ncbi:trehalose-phosphatase [Roseibium litorale]|uniref:Trehalose 6-phosphate phosphatase n=1 Tax=Roseibium litorale TaxID=2803841 RepID=A0ABR9CM62_9HYPH|nr:trehalose-phosphatase [Roseibium litorale]MBD8891934.1 trehalose-phosphatase [Roseibium litorale]
MTDLPHLEPDMALFLDFDGTLVELAARPQDVRVDPSLSDVLVSLQDLLGGAVAVVSGRPVEQIDAFLQPVRLPAAGLHGLEQRDAPGGKVLSSPPDNQITRLAHHIAGSGLLERGVTLEDKGPAIALHYRAVPELEAEVVDFMTRTLSLLPDLHMVHGKMVAEAKPKGRDKGTALRGFMEREPFSGRRPVFIGDDVTDEDGLSAANAGGGFGIKVGDGPTCARFRLANVTAVLEWLQAGRDALEDARPQQER